MMFQNFYPNKLIRSVYELNWEELSRTYGGVIFDIDNTLVPHGAAADEAAIQLFARIWKAKNMRHCISVQQIWLKSSTRKVIM